MSAFSFDIPSFSPSPTEHVSGTLDVHRSIRQLGRPRRACACPPNRGGAECSKSPTARGAMRANSVARHEAHVGVITVGTSHNVHLSVPRATCLPAKLRAWEKRRL